MVQSQQHRTVLHLIDRVGNGRQILMKQNYRLLCEPNVSIKNPLWAMNELSMYARFVVFGQTQMTKTIPLLRFECAFPPLELSNGYFDIDTFIESDIRRNVNPWKWIIDCLEMMTKEKMCFKTFEMNEVLASFRAYFSALPTCLPVFQSFDTRMPAYSQHTCPIRVGATEHNRQYHTHCTIVQQQ